jgi:hypothetical protein
MKRLFATLFALFLGLFAAGVALYRDKDRGNYNSRRL